ncbi:MAG: STAS domain-containing protein [Bacteroidales bacterium]|nr:STAS domain-containing protein [Bacteroidales bacterium]
MINFNYNKQENSLLCSLEGRMGADIANELSGSIQDKIDGLKGLGTDPENLKIIFDLQQVDFIASSFIRICVKTAKQLKKDGFEVTNTSPMIKKTFKIAGLDQILNVS